MTAAAIPYLMAATAAAGVYSSVQQGKAADNASKAQAQQAEAQAQQAEAEAKSQIIERKRALIQTMAAQNVGAAAQGRTISSISALQSEDARRAGYDETLIKGGAAATSSAYKSAAQASLSAGKSAKQAGYINAGSSLLSGATGYAQTLSKD